MTLSYKPSELQDYRSYRRMQVRVRARDSELTIISTKMISTNDTTRDNALSGALDQVLEPNARERLSRVNLVRPERARAVEQYIVKLVQSGQIRRKLGESDIVEILDGLARDESKRNETQIVFSRKQVDDDDDFFD
jgi:programmed cell death protein 5